MGESGALRATKANERNSHHAEAEAGLLISSFIKDDRESAAVGRAALGMRAITFVLARSLAKPVAIPQAVTSDGWLGGSGGAVDRPRHS